MQIIQIMSFLVFFFIVCYGSVINGKLYWNHVDGNTRNAIETMSFWKQNTKYNFEDDEEEKKK